MSITVLNPGLLTTVQDMGRIGYQQFGVSVSGVMDPRAAATANILVGNPEDEAVLECTMLGPQLRFDAANTIALTGGDLMASLDGQPVPTYRAIAVQAGQTLRFQAPKTGCRAYIAFTGGLDIPRVMGSRSTYMKAKIGGFQGRKLQKDDVIGFRAPGAPKNLNERYIYPEFIPRPVYTIRVVMGPQDDAFPERGIATFLGADHRLLHQEPQRDLRRLPPPGPADGRGQGEVRERLHPGRPGGPAQPAGRPAHSAPVPGHVTDTGPVPPGRGHPIRRDGNYGI